MADFRTDTSAIRVEPNKGMSLADMLNLSRGALEYKKEQELYQPAVEQAKALSETAQIGANKAKALMQPEIEAGVAKSKKEKLGFENTESQIIFDEMNSLAANPFIKNYSDPQKAAQALSEAKQRARDRGADATKIDLMSAPLFNKILNGQGNTIHQGLLDSINAAQNTSQFGQVTGVTPVATGQTTEFVQTSPFVKNPTKSVQMELPPNTPKQNEEGQIEYLGANKPNAPVVREQGPMFNEKAKIAQTDWSTTTADLKDSANRIPVIQNLKKLGPEAFTGVGGERKEKFAGLLGAFGIDYLTAEKTATDELAKNSAILQMAGGNTNLATDLARTIKDAATPNKKMTKEAIDSMADQLLGVEKLKQAKFNFLQPFTKDINKYNEKLGEFAKFADYRLFQEMTPSEVAKLKASMSPTQQKEVSDKIAEAKRLGILK